MTAPWKIATWNVNGVRARWAQLIAWVADERPDVFCLQELKASPDQIPEALTALPDYASCWHGGAVKGYAGVSLHVRRDRLAAGAAPPRFCHPTFDAECRAVETTLSMLGRDVTLWSIYAPNGGKDYPAKLAFFETLIAEAAALRASGRSLILCGDLNITREERDVHPSQRKPDVIGQRPEERALLARLLTEGGLVDVGREAKPDDERLFTWWPMWKGAKERNLGWRLDYVLASAGLAKVDGCEVRRAIGASDHGPVVATLST